MPWTSLGVDKIYDDISYRNWFITSIMICMTIYLTVIGVLRCWIEPLRWCAPTGVLGNEPLAFNLAFSITRRAELITAIVAREIGLLNNTEQLMHDSLSVYIRIEADSESAKKNYLNGNKLKYDTIARLGAYSVKWRLFIVPQKLKKLPT